VADPQFARRELRFTPLLGSPVWKLGWKKIDTTTIGPRLARPVCLSHALELESRSVTPWERLAGWLPSPEPPGASVDRPARSVFSILAVF
jgi:hypothetical protein